VPGGFSYGDYLRCGAIARFSPIMKAVAGFAGDGGLVLGICNGFQILTEAGLLPGVLRPNASLSFVCRDVPLRVERTDTPFTSRCIAGQELTIPVKHGDGCWFADDELLGELDRVHSRQREAVSQVQASEDQLARAEKMFEVRRTSCANRTL